MGSIYYGGSATPIAIDDLALAHLQVVITTKLRRAESFTVSWPHPESEGRGRSTLWIHPAIPLRLVFDTPQQVPLDREWLTQLAASANATGGIQLTADHFGAAESSGTDNAPRRIALAPVGTLAG